MELEDFTGLDTAMRIGQQVFQGLSNATEPPRALVDRVNRGELGVKTGKGWYDYHGHTREDLVTERNRRLIRLLASLKSIND